MAIARQGSGIARVDMGSATINMCDDGSFTLLVGATDLGTGSDTILSQICAETIGVDFDKINIIASDTDITPYDGGAYASSTTYVTGNAVLKAASEMKRLIELEGAKVLGVEVDNVEFNGKEVKVEGYNEKISLEDLATKLIYTRKQLTAPDSYLAHKSPPPYMSEFAEVEVDLEIGKMITNNLMKYKIPTRKDIGRITVEFAESYEPTGPFGAKSIGEVVINSSSPAIQDAIFNATGVRVRSLPITPEKVLKGLKQLSKKK